MLPHIMGLSPCRRKSQAPRRMPNQPSRLCLLWHHMPNLLQSHIPSIPQPASPPSFLIPLLPMRPPRQLADKACGTGWQPSSGIMGGQWQAELLKEAPLEL